MEIKTKFDVGDEAWFFKGWYKTKRRILYDITRGIVCDIRTWTDHGKRTDISYMLATPDGTEEIPEKYLHETYSEIAAITSDRSERKECDLVKVAYEQLGKQLGLI